MRDPFDGEIHGVGKISYNLLSVVFRAVVGDDHLEFSRDALLQREAMQASFQVRRPLERRENNRQIRLVGHTTRTTGVAPASLVLLRAVEREPRKVGEMYRKALWPTIRALVAWAYSTDWQFQQTGLGSWF
jgi:hypothetical protein